MLLLAAQSAHPTIIAVLLTIVGEVLAVLVVWRILSSERGTSATISWILVILIAPWLGLAAYYLLGRNLHRRRLKRHAIRTRVLEPNLGAVDYDAPSGRETENPPVINLLCGFGTDAVHGGNEAVLLPDGEGFVRAAKHAIEHAERFIHLQTYILRPDETGLRVLAALTEAASRGVEVRVLFDSIGSWFLKGEHLVELHAAGGKSAAFMPLLWRHRPFTLNLRNHRKLLVVDGQVAYCGGRNIGDEYAHDRFGRAARWFDTMIQIRGPVVSRLHRVFVEDWYTAAEEDLSGPEYFPAATTVCSPGARIGVVDGGPDVQPSRHYLTLFQLLASARSSVTISSPYLVPNQTLLTALTTAALRGVHVSIHTNGKRAEAGILFHAKRYFYPALLEAGVEIFETREDYNHAKLVVVDEELLFIGSPNLDVRSTELNFELGVVVHDDPVVAESLMMIRDRCASSQQVREADLATGALSRALQRICYLLAPVL
ncbi:MAG: cardiolipin synthase [Planctomycetes bacterium]|nr:cardiolipin synthase [Planctomycetota bacterium]